MTGASISVVIPTRNQQQFLADAVRSAFNQSLPPIEVVVSDDASTDQTPAVLAGLQRDFGSQLRVFRQKSNLGIATNTDWVMRQAQGDFIVRLDSDDLLGSAFCERLSHLLLCWPDSGYAHAVVQEMDENGRYTRLRHLARTAGYLTGEEALRQAVAGYRVAANICMFRRAALEAVNFVTERPTYTEDFDLAVRLADAGYGNVYCPETLASYRVWLDQKMERPKRKQQELQGLIVIYREVLRLAFERRGWDTGVLDRRARKLAAEHAVSLAWSGWSGPERQELLTLLVRLGDGPELRRNIWMLSCWPGRWLLRSSGALKATIRSAAKRALYR